MSQSAALLTPTGAIQVELPDPRQIAVEGVPWGLVEAFPTPAYWRFQALALRLAGASPRYRLGRSLAEEVGACLLGGHGIPANVGLAAYDRLRERGAFAGRHDEAELRVWLTEPLKVAGRPIRYRFAAQKARYLSASMPLVAGLVEARTGRELRDSLLKLPGVGMKTASWIARNWLAANDVAILDIHILRVGQTIGLFPLSWTPENRYLDLEERFLALCRAIDIAASELDSVIWAEMASSPSTVRRLIEHLREIDPARPVASRSTRRIRPIRPAVAFT